MRGVDENGPCLIVVIDHFIKWIETKPLAKNELPSKRYNFYRKVWYADMNSNLSWWWIMGKSWVMKNLRSITITMTWNYVLHRSSNLITHGSIWGHYRRKRHEALVKYNKCSQFKVKTIIEAYNKVIAWRKTTNTVILPVDANLPKVATTLDAYNRSIWNTSPI